MSTSNSYFDDLADLSVKDILTSSELIEAAITELMEGEQFYDLLFDPFNVGELTVGYNLDTAAGLEEEVQKVAEFAEIPVGDPLRGERRYTDLTPVGIGLRVSYQQRNFGTGSAVQRELVGRAAEIRRRNGREAIAALAGANVEEIPLRLRPWMTSTPPTTSSLALLTTTVSASATLASTCWVTAVPSTR